MQASALQAIIPKARGMYSRHISKAQYEELMRRRTVQELASILKNHPYFRNSLGTLSTLEPHRGQIEELLSMDIFLKYESLLRYDFSDNRFAEYYLAELEMNEVLKALRLISTSQQGVYTSQIPDYLVERLNIDLFKLAQANTFEDVVKAAKSSSYYKVLRGCFLADPTLADFALCEAALLRQYYDDLFASAKKTFTGRELSTVESLFLQEIEAYNLEIIFRVKTYFPGVYTPAQLRALLLPQTYSLSRRKLDALIDSPVLNSLPPPYNKGTAERFTGTPLPMALMASVKLRIYKHAKSLLHLTASPMAALVAFISLVKLERENVVNVVEGVRYGLAPEDIRPLLKF